MGLERRRVLWIDVVGAEGYTFITHFEGHEWIWRLPWMPIRSPRPLSNREYEYVGSWSQC
jgi:hypothetical protein